MCGRCAAAWARPPSSASARASPAANRRPASACRASAGAPPRHQPPDIADLEAIFADIERDVAAGGTGEEPDVRFHCAIAKAAGNTVLTHLMATLHGALAKASRLLASRLMDSGHYRDGMFELHARIFDAIRAHDPKAAAQKMDAQSDFVVREFSQYRARAGDS